MTIHVNRALFLAILLAASGCAAPETDLGSEEELGTDVQEVQSAGINKYYTYVRETTRVAHSTAAVLAPFRDAAGNQETIEGIPLRGTCGITFIAPHYAMTAAHCVDAGQVPNPAAQTVTVESYDIQGMSTWELAFSGLVLGRWPNFNFPVPIANNDAYVVKTQECKVVSRCVDGFNCSFGADIALLYCPSRHYSADWMPIASSDALTGPVEMSWFHEVYGVPFTGTGLTGDNLDRFQHYTEYTNHSQNYHYLGGGKNHLLPLKSTNFPAAQGGGSPRRLLDGSSDTISGIVWTDLFGCHGSSGSGVFQRNSAGELEFLGPVKLGGNWAGSRLCTDGDQHEPGVRSLAYTASAASRKLFSDNFALLNGDRNYVRSFLTPTADFQRSFGPLGQTDKDGTPVITLSAGNVGVSTAVLKFDNVVGTASVVHEATLNVYIESPNVRIEVRDPSGAVLTSPDPFDTAIMRSFDIKSLATKWKNGTETRKWVTLHYANSVFGSATIRATEHTNPSTDPWLHLVWSP
jgi:hypothetical protein